MAVRPILIVGEPVLHTPATPVTVFDEALRALVDDLVETMTAAPGVGLAAPQVGVDARVFVYDWTDADGVRWHGSVVNPELWITPTPTGDADPEEESEGCLSVPGERYPLRRAERALLRFADVDGAPAEVRADGWLARIFQHEFDHLEGRLYVDRLDHAHRKPVAKVMRKSGWGVPGNSWMPGEDDLDA